MAAGRDSVVYETADALNVLEKSAIPYAAAFLYSGLSIGTEHISDFVSFEKDILSPLIFYNISVVDYGSLT